MRIIELLNSLKLPINNEQAEILSLFDENEIILKSDLAPREQLLANELVNQNILLRKQNDDGKITYRKKIR